MVSLASVRCGVSFDGTGQFRKHKIKVQVTSPMPVTCYLRPVQFDGRRRPDDVPRDRRNA
jgi:hypothetical protein